jgi:hypothetical protein
MIDTFVLLARAISRLFRIRRGLLLEHRSRVTTRGLEAKVSQTEALSFR